MLGGAIHQKISPKTTWYTVEIPSPSRRPAREAAAGTPARRRRGRGEKTKVPMLRTGLPNQDTGIELGEGLPSLR